MPTDEEFAVSVVAERDHDGDRGVGRYLKGA